MGLGSIRGQERALRALGLAIEQGRFHHAYRFEGPDGVGKELTATGLAKVLNCENRGTLEIPADGSQEGVTLPDFCGTCLPCRKIAGGNHPDIRMVAADKGKKDISIDKVRDLHGWVIYPPSEGRAKVVIVRDADRITEAGANAFLKMLEEPPPSTHFFLVTSRPHSLLHTITSRSVPVRFIPLAPADMKAVLAGMSLEPEDEGRLDDVIALSGGSVSAALGHLSEEFTELLDVVVRLDGAFAGTMADLGDLLDDVSITRATVGAILNFLEMYYRDVAWMGVTGDPGGLLLHSLEDRIRARTGTLPPDVASSMALRIPEHRALLEGYVNPRMVLERLHMELRGEWI